MKMTVIVPTWQRPDSLERCLHALLLQEHPADEVIVVSREDDAPTRALLASIEAPAIKIVTPSRPGVVAALNAGFDAASGDVLAITDDDSEPLPDWLGKIEEHFARDPKLGGLGGRDRIVGSEETTPKPERLAVGHVYWFGRVVGNHHLATGGVRDVEIIKGVNMSLRRSALGKRRLDPTLRGEGVEHNWEIELCLALRSEGWRLRHDPGVEVMHHESPRPVGQREQQMSSPEHSDAVYNQTLALANHLHGVRRLAAVTYALLCGTRQNPGPLFALQIVLAGTAPKKAITAMETATAARWQAIKQARRQRATAH